ncbi:hypothetical protein CYMTET_38318 [Cymbomonas tetramitiformis]|uniref:Uncharacterized protein n=1 Tax=Cymbomonas tetramitiformis TaxID=36881 RepID=A0AAE0CDQ4_9CHLO|nr:hypothetical protein CYMTET_38320 [Cymbomonas tetramitiformis]KAK3252379.1 hypothetical protein CYMTET_38318 [Cymbomonas tetramitiformis]
MSSSVAESILSSPVLTEASPAVPAAPLSEDEEDLESLVSGSDSEDGEVPLDEMLEDVVDQPKRRRTTITVAAAAVQSNHGVEDFSARGRVHAGTMEAEAYELLKKRMLGGLTEEQIAPMA